MRRAGLASLLVHLAFLGAMGRRAPPPPPHEDERPIEITVVDAPEPPAAPPPAPEPPPAPPPRKAARAHQAPAPAEEAQAQASQEATGGPDEPAAGTTGDPDARGTAVIRGTPRPPVDLFDPRSAARAARGVGAREGRTLPEPERVPRTVEPMPAAPPLTPHTRFRHLEQDVAASFHPSPSALRAGQVNLLQRWYLAPKGPVGPRLGNDLLAPEAQQDVGKPQRAPRGAPGLEVARVEIDVEHAPSGATTRILLRLSSGRRNIDAAALEAVQAALSRLAPTPPPEVARLGTLCSRWVLRAESLPTSTAIPGFSLALEALEDPVPRVEAFLAELASGPCAPGQPRQIRSQNAR